ARLAPGVAAAAGAVGAESNQPALYPALPATASAPRPPRPSVRNFLLPTFVAMFVAAFACLWGCRLLCAGLPGVLRWAFDLCIWEIIWCRGRGGRDLCWATSSRR